MNRDSTPAAKLLRVEVVYALPERQVVIALEVKAGTTAMQAMERSGILDQFPEIDLAQAKVGIFGKVVPLETPLQDGARVEVYRPLTADPKVARRERAKKTGG